MNLPPHIVAHAQRYEHAAPRGVHRSKISLARLVASDAPPEAVHQLALAEQYLAGNASAEELAEARKDAWAYIGSLACYCTVSDSLSSQAILDCLETDDRAHTLTSLLEQSERVLRCGVSETRVASALAEACASEGAA